MHILRPIYTALVGGYRGAGLSNQCEQHRHLLFTKEGDEQDNDVDQPR